jgi:hypothetical protein
MMICLHLEQLCNALSTKEKDPKKKIILSVYSLKISILLEGKGKSSRIEKLISQMKEVLLKENKDFLKWNTQIEHFASNIRGVSFGLTSSWVDFGTGRFS